MTRPTLCLALLLLASPTVMALPVTMPASTAASESLLQVGIRHLGAGDLAAAEAALRGHLRQNPADVDALMWLAEVRFRSDDVDGAGTILGQVVKLRPNHAPAHQALGRYHYLKRDFDASERALKIAIALDPALFAAHVDLADHYLMVRNDPERSIESYDAAVRIDPEHAGAWFGLGEAHRRAGDADGAAAAWRKSASFDPKNPLPLHALGKLMLEQREVDAALDAFDAALAAEPRHLDSLLARGRIYAARNDDAQALAQFDAALSINDSYAPAHLYRAVLLQRQGDRARAVEGYRRTLALRDEQPLAHNNLAWLLAQDAGQRTEALGHARRATELAPQVGAYWDTLGWLQHRLGDNDAALLSLNRAADLKKQPGTFEHLASVYRAIGEPEAAERADRMAASLRRD